MKQTNMYILLIMVFMTVSGFAIAANDSNDISPSVVEFVPECSIDADCPDDGNMCNGEAICSDNVCLETPPVIFDDGLYCNGFESCDPGTGDIIPGIPPACDDKPGPDACYEEGICNEAKDSCEYTFVDNDGPVTSDVSVNPVYNNGVFDTVALASDVCSDIKKSEYFTRVSSSGLSCGTPGTGNSLPAFDGNFDELVEDLLKSDVEFYTDGSNKICVQSQDALGNWGNCECFYYETDTVPPEFVKNTFINGVSEPQEVLVCGDDPLIETTVCDTQSEIQGGEFFIDMLIPPSPVPAPWTGEWLNPTNQYTGPLGRHCSDLNGTIPLFGLDDGTHYINQIRGKDIVENWGKIYNQNLNYSFIKDTTPPITFKQLNPMDDLIVECDGSEESILPDGVELTDGCGYVKAGTNVTLTAFDFNPDDSANDGYNNNNPGEYAGDVVIHYKVWYRYNETDDWVINQEGTSDLGEVTFILEEDSYHLIEYWSVDGCSWEEEHHFELDIVDTKAPISTKELIGDEVVACSQEDIEMYGIEDCAYITKDVTVSLSCADQEPHPVGVSNFYYRIDWKENFEDDFINGTVVEVDGTKTRFNYQEDSFHRLTWWCQDKLGNVEEKHVELDLVDTRAPELLKTIGMPKISCEDVIVPPSFAAAAGAECFDEQCVIPEECYYITQNTSVEFNCDDLGPHPVDNVTINWSWTWDDGEFKGMSELFSVNSNYTNFTFTEDSWHTLYYQCSDALGNTVRKIEFDVVDTEGPVIVSKEFFGPQVNCAEDDPNECHSYITQDTVIKFTAEDVEPHPVGIDYCEYRYKINDGNFTDWQVGSMIDPQPPVEQLVAVPLTNMFVWQVQYDEDSRHTIEYKCVDRLGNWGPTYVEVDVVDTMAPNTTKEVIGTQVDGDMNPIHKYITKDTVINLTCVDPEPHPVNDVELYWTVEWSRDCVDPNWESIDKGMSDTGMTSITDLDDSCHKLTYWCVDALGNTEEQQIEIDAVDNSAPRTMKFVSEPKVPLCVDKVEEFDESDFSNNEFGVDVIKTTNCDKTTWEVTLSENDGHWHTGAVLVVTDGSDVLFQTGWNSQDISAPFYQPYSAGWLAKEPLPAGITVSGNYNENHYIIEVDNSYLNGNEFGWALNTESSWPGHSSAVQQNFPSDWVRWTAQNTYMNYPANDWVISGDTNISFECSDIDPHPVGDVKTYWRWRYSELGDVWTDWSETMEYDDNEGPINFDEASFHEIEYWCVDALGNEETHQYEIDAVDLDAPTTTKTLGEPKLMCEGDDCHYWITQETDIELTCEDYPLHPSGADEIYYRYSLDGGNFTDWMTYVEPFTFGEDSNHTLEYYCVDKFENVEVAQVELDRVDTEGPVIVKWVDDTTVQPGDSVYICANVTDIKQTLDPGVGVDEETIFARMELGDDPIWVSLLNTEGNTYCGYFEAPPIKEKCHEFRCVWNVYVEAEDLLGNYNEENGIQIIVDAAAPKIEAVLNPPSGRYYRDGKPFSIYAPAIDFGGDMNIKNWDNCKASEVLECRFYAFDYPFELVNQSEIKNWWNWRSELHEIYDNPLIVELGSVPYVDGVCVGQVQLPPDSGLTDKAFLAYEIEDNAGNIREGMAKDADGDLILMDIDNDGPGVMITELGNIVTPLTSGDNIAGLVAEIVDFESGFDGCYADLFMVGENETIDTGVNIEGEGLEFNVCEINGILPDGLASGNYELRVNARDELFNVGFDWASLVVDNTRPTMGLIHPEKNGVYGEIMPISLFVTDSQSLIAPETVMVRIHEFGGFGNLWCLAGCEDTGWIGLTLGDNNLYTTMVNLSDSGISGDGRYNFDAIACDELYVADEDVDNPLGLDINEDRNTRHCKMISAHGVEKLERAACNDGIDNDMDGFTDYAGGDAGCDSVDDNDEVDEIVIPVCGNEVIEDGEDCDDGNLIDGDGCSAICTIENNNLCVDTKTYTMNLDFDEGTLVNVEHDTFADQLQLVLGQATDFPLLWVANAGEDSVSKFNTQTGEELARYHTWFGPLANHDAWSGPAPSRTAVDSEGNAYVANRQFSSNQPANVIKILADDWIDRNGNGILDTSFDANNDGEIDSTEMLPFFDNNSNGIIDDEEITDERIAWVANVGTNNCLGRSLAIDLNGDIWLGCYNERAYYKIDGTNGSPLLGPISTTGHSPYGAIVDKDGILWGASLSSNLLKLDTNTGTVLNIYSHSAWGSDYGIAISYDENGSTIVYKGSNSGRTFIKFESVTETFSTPASSFAVSTLGIATDSDGNVFVGDGWGGTGDMYKFYPNGTLIWHSSGQVASEIRGTVVDSDDNVWAVHRASSKTAKFSGVDGTHLGIFNTGLYPYTYSDASGVGLLSGLSTGKWNVIFDTGYVSTDWGLLDWNELLPEQTNMEVKVRSSNDQVAWSSWETVTKGVSLDTTPQGQYLEIEVSMQAFAQEAPVLYDITASGVCSETV